MLDVRNGPGRFRAEQISRPDPRSFANARDWRECSRRRPIPVLLAKAARSSGSPKIAVSSRDAQAQPHAATAALGDPIAQLIGRIGLSRIERRKRLPVAFGFGRRWQCTNCRCLGRSAAQAHAVDAMLVEIIQEQIGRYMAFAADDRRTVCARRRHGPPHVGMGINSHDRQRPRCPRRLALCSTSASTRWQTVP